MDDGASDDVERIRRERDLFRRLLELSSQEDLEPFLDEVLELVVEMTRAECGYLELYGPLGVQAGPKWSLVKGCSNEQVEQIRQSISGGIVAAALQSGRTIITPSALLDPRFRERMRAASIEAVLCAPVSLDAPVGIVYLQGRPGTAPFGETDRRRVEMFARQVAPLCDRLLLRRQMLEGDDPTQPLRARLKLDGVVGRSRALAAALQDAAAAVPLRDVTVLLTGETGTGKKHLARILHENSPRAGGPFIEFRTPGPPDSHAEADLFGSVGGVSGLEATIGKLGAAHAGTLFLEEIGELPASLQARLLKFLLSREYVPTGGASPRTADVRLIATTSIDLAGQVAAGAFRADLFHRIDVLRIHMPSLAARREDVPELAQHLCGVACRREGWPPLRLSAAAALAAQLADWPGNIRQLANAIDRAVARAAAEEAPVIERRHLFDDAADDGSEGRLTWQEATRRFQRELLARTIREHGGNITKVAEELDLVRSHVYTMKKAFGLDERRRR